MRGKDNLKKKEDEMRNRKDKRLVKSRWEQSLFRRGEDWANGSLPKKNSFKGFATDSVLRVSKQKDRTRKGIGIC